MLTETIIRNCAPTLAGLKAGNLFACRYKDCDELKAVIEKQNTLINPKGVYLVLIKVNPDSALVYVYRKNRLEKILADKEIQDFLTPFGYSNFQIDSCLEVLKERLLHRDFPHDIGVFLDYPLPDIKAFIENKGANCPITGCWKAYTNIEEAERKFSLFKQCTRIYCQSYIEGMDITRLTVAA